jgi:hypothetical protein
MKGIVRATRTVGRYWLPNTAAEDALAVTSVAGPRFFGAPNKGALPAEYWTPNVETQLKSWIVDFVQAEEDWLLSDARKNETQFKAFMATYYTPTAMLIRPSGCPSGNPMTQEGWMEMMGKEDVKLTSKKLLAISHVATFGGHPYSGELNKREPNGAVVVYTTHEKFTHNGNAYDDISSWSVTLSKHGFHGNKWMLEHLQSSPPAA